MPESPTLESCPDSGRASPIQLSENESDGGDNRGTARDRPLDRPAVDEDDIGESEDNEEMLGPSRKRRRSKKDPDKEFECPREGCGKTYSRVEHLHRHQLNHDPEQIHHCDFPDCHRTFVRQDLCASHKQRHTAGGSQLPLKDTSLPNLNPGVPAATPESASKSPATSEIRSSFFESPIQIDDTHAIGKTSMTPSPHPIQPVGNFPDVNFQRLEKSSQERENRDTSNEEPIHPLREQRSPSTDETTTTASSPERLFADPFGLADTKVNTDDRLLNPTKYIDKIKQLRQMAFQNSAIKYQFETNTPSSKIPHDYILFRQLCELITKTCDSLRSLQYEGFCGHFFSVLVLDKSRSNVAQLLPIEIEKVKHLRNIFQETLEKNHPDKILQTIPTTLNSVLHKSQNNNSPMLPNSSSFPSSTLLKAKYRKVDEQKASRTEDDPGVSIMSNIPQKLISACCDLLGQLQILPVISKPLDLVPLFAWDSKLLSKLPIQRPWHIPTLQVVPLLAMTVQFLDLAVLSYVGTHTGAVDDLYISQVDGTIHLPGRFGALQGITWDSLHCIDNIILQKRQLKCLDQFLGYRTVWVFHTQTHSSSNKRLYLSTDVTTLTDVWGPLWKLKSDANSSKVSRYDIGNGFIVPWDRDQEIDPHPSTNGEGGIEVFCHWMPTREWDDDYVEQHQKEVFSKEFFESDRLLIGASTKDRLVVNDHCAMSMIHKLQIKQAMKNAGNLRHRGTCMSHRERGSQTFQVQASAAGFATLGTTLEYKRVEGFNIKDALLQRWRNGSRNIKYLEIWGGLEVSLCTKNARRVQLLHLLRSPGLRRYLETICFQWSSPECESAYFEALKNRRNFRKFWRGNPAWQRNIGDAINQCFIALEETGVDERDDALSALWVEVFDNEVELETDDSTSEFVVAEEHLVILRRSEHTWTGLLKDSPECITMAVAESVCLEFDVSNSYSMRCQNLRFSRDGRNARRYASGYSVLQTAILVNEDLLGGSDSLRYITTSRKRKMVECEKAKAHVETKNGPRRKQDFSYKEQYNREYFGDASKSWNGYWGFYELSEGTKFSLGSHGHLRVIPALSLSYPVLMEWEPVINTKGKEVKREFLERAFGMSGERHHSEYIGGEYWRSPLPCLVMSKKQARNNNELRMM